MSRRRRNELVEFARGHYAVIVEDDHDGEFRFDGAPLEALRNSNFADVAFHVGTLSKCMLRRCGSASSSLRNWQSSTLAQISVSDFIAEGHLERHIRKTRQIYRKRRFALLHGLKHCVAEWLTPLPSVYGMHVIALARAKIDLDCIATGLAQKGVSVHTLSRYFLGPETTMGLIFRYATTDLPEIDKGLSMLRTALFEAH